MDIETKAELENVKAKYATLQAECSAESDRHTKSSCAKYHDIAFDNGIIG